MHMGVNFSSVLPVSSCDGFVTLILVALKFLSMCHEAYSGQEELV